MIINRADISQDDIENFDVNQYLPAGVQVMLAWFLLLVSTLITYLTWKDED